VVTPQDEEHLRLLSIFHYVVAAIGMIASLFPVIHLIVGIVAVTGGLDEPGRTEGALVGWFFIVFSLAWIVTGLGISTCLVLAGRSLRRRQRYTFCLVMAGIACMFAPFGTVLGVFTILVLIRESVKAAFGVSAAPVEAAGS
jgi:hypothetical protein